MLRKLTEGDYCPLCKDQVLYMGEAEYNLVEWRCPECKYREIRLVKIAKKDK